MVGIYRIFLQTFEREANFATEIRRNLIQTQPDSDTIGFRRKLIQPKPKLATLNRKNLNYYESQKVIVTIASGSGFYFPYIVCKCRHFE